METDALAAHLGGVAAGPRRSVSGLSPVEAPEAGTVVVVRSAKEFATRRTLTELCWVVPDGLETPTELSVIRVRDPRLAFAQLSALFDLRPLPPAGVSARADVHPSASVAEDVSIGAFTVVAEGAVVGAGTVIGPHCVVGANSRVGVHCRLHASVTLYDKVVLGDRVVLHSGVVVGSDGFGYAASAQGAAKIHHLGGVVVEDDVEVGANSCIDRATLGETRIGARSKIDNLCQIAHNVVIGSDCLIAGLSGIAGSTVIGDRVVVGGSAGFTDHVRVGAGARIAGRAGVTKDVPAGETWAGFPAVPQRKWARQHYLLGQLERIWQTVKPFTRPGGR